MTRAHTAGVSLLAVGSPKSPDPSRMPDTVAGAHQMLTEYFRKESGIWEALAPNVRREGGRAAGGFSHRLDSRYPMAGEEST